MYIMSVSYTRMTWIWMIKPVVMICKIIWIPWICWCCIYKSTFSTVKKVIIWYCTVLWLLDIYRAITLFLVAVWTSLSIIYIKIMNPYITVACVYWYSIIHEIKHWKISYFNICCISHKNTEVFYTGIAADTLYCKLHIRISIFSLYLKSFWTAAYPIKIILCHCSYNTDINRSCFLAFLKGINNILDANTFSSLIRISLYCHSNSFSSIFCYIQYNCILF